MAHPGLLGSLPTPALVLDEGRMLSNIDRLRERVTALGVKLRPHLKTPKSVEVARRLLANGNGPATVSTLKEAEVFFAAGVSDILYAVGIAPQKLPQVLALLGAGCDLTVLVDTIEQANAVAAASFASGTPIPVLIEVDCDGHRGGVTLSDGSLIEIGKVITDGGAELRGVMTHAGESYNAVGERAQAAFAELERKAAVEAAERLRAAALSCPIVSVGSTPTAHAAKDMSGVTEVRAGVYVFFDLVMAGIGVCSIDDIALTVLTTVIGHQRDRGRIFVDAGWMALSRDRGTAGQRVDQGYGVVCDIGGRILPDLIVAGTNQEHGIVTLRPGIRSQLPEMEVGTRLRILPNHACATASQFDTYNVIPASGSDELQRWARFGGW